MGTRGRRARPTRPNCGPSRRPSLRPTGRFKGRPSRPNRPRRRSRSRPTPRSPSPRSPSCSNSGPSRRRRWRRWRPSGRAGTQGAKPSRPPASPARGRTRAEGGEQELVLGVVRQVDGVGRARSRHIADVGIWHKGPRSKTHKCGWTPHTCRHASSCTQDRKAQTDVSSPRLYAAGPEPRHLTRLKASVPIPPPPTTLKYHMTSSASPPPLHCTVLCGMRPQGHSFVPSILEEHTKTWLTQEQPCWGNTHTHKVKMSATP